MLLKSVDKLLENAGAAALDSGLLLVERKKKRYVFYLVASGSV